MLKGKRIVVTGGSSGIGKSLVKGLLNEGAHVLAVSRSIEKGVFEPHERLVLKNIDVSTKAGHELLFETAKKHLGVIDVFVANAGFAYYEMFNQVDETHVRNIMDLNLNQVIMQAVEMRQRYSSFQFMVTLSAVSFLSMPGYALYGASKAGLKAFIDSYRYEVDAEQVFQSVYPVATKTDFFNRANQSHKPWPVQDADHVAKVMIKGLKTKKKNIYPSKLFKWGLTLAPWAFGPYVKRQQKIFFQSMKELNKPS